MNKISCFIFCLTALFSFSSQAVELTILQPNYACQSKEFSPDDHLSVTVLQDKVSGMNHIELAHAWFGGVRKAYFAVSERVEKNGNNQPVIFEGPGIQLSIERTLQNEQHPFEAALHFSTSQGDVVTKLMLCESLHEQKSDSLR